MSKKGFWLRLSGSFGGSGLSRFMPGTCGTLAASALIGVVEFYQIWPWWWMLVAGAISFVIGVPLATAAVKHFDKDDPQWFVVDEVAGVLLATAGLAHLIESDPVIAVALGFFCFRVFDILKPWPIRRFEKIGIGFGVMIDDILAAVMAWPCAYGLLLLLARV